METEKELSSVAKLKMALNKLIELKASNIEDLIAQKESEVVVGAKEWENALKIIDKMPNLDAFEKIANGIGTGETPPTEVTGNPFEERSKILKQKLNGQTTN